MNSFLSWKGKKGRLPEDLNLMGIAKRSFRFRRITVVLKSCFSSN